MITVTEAWRGMRLTVCWPLQVVMLLLKRGRRRGLNMNAQDGQGVSCREAVHNMFMRAQHLEAQACTSLTVAGEEEGELGAGDAGGDGKHSQMASLVEPKLWSHALRGASGLHES